MKTRIPFMIGSLLISSFIITFGIIGSKRTGSSFAELYKDNLTSNI